VPARNATRRKVCGNIHGTRWHARVTERIESKPIECRSSFNRIISFHADIEDD